MALYFYLCLKMDIRYKLIAQTGSIKVYELACILGSSDDISSKETRQFIESGFDKIIRNLADHTPYSAYYQSYLPNQSVMCVLVVGDTNAINFL
jgi:hypothetical protein